MSQQQPQKQKQKDNNAPNNSGKQYRPKTATQPATEAVKESKPRPETAEPSNRGQRGNNRGRGRGGRDGDKEGERRERRNDPRSDKNSWMYKYWHEPRPKNERIVVDKDTELPELIKKEDMIARPSKEKMEEEANAIEASIKELQAKKKALHTKLQEIKQGGKMKDSQHTYKEVFQQKITEKQELNATKKRLFD